MTWWRIRGGRRGVRAGAVAVLLLGGAAGAFAAEQLPHPFGTRPVAMAAPASPAGAVARTGEPTPPGAGGPASLPFGAVISGGVVTTPVGATASPQGAAAAAPLPTSTATPETAPAVTPEAAPGAAAGADGAAAPDAAPQDAPATTPQGTYHVVGLGDSVPAGTACGCDTYVSLVGRARAAALGLTPDVSDLAVPGLTTAGLVDQLGDPDVAAAVAGADLVIVTIGANDFDPDQAGTDACAPPGLDCYRPQLDAQPAQLDAVLDRIAALEAGHPATVVVTDYWDVFLDGDVGQAQGPAYVAASDALTAADNAVIEAAAGRHDATFVDLFAPFRGDGSTDDTALLADDGDHPDAAGHRLIARTIEAALG